MAAIPDEAGLGHEPPILGVEEREVLDWDFSLEQVPERPSGKIRVRIRPKLESELPPGGDGSDDA